MYRNKRKGMIFIIKIFSIRILSIFSLFILYACAPPQSSETLLLNGNWEYRYGYSTSLQNDLSNDSADWKPIQLPFLLASKDYPFNGYTGWVTFKKRFVLPEKIFNEPGNIPLSIEVGRISDVSKIFINDYPIGGYGSTDPYMSGSNLYFLGDIPGSKINKDENFLSITLYSNGEFPIFLSGPKLQIGPSSVIYSQYYKNQILDIVLMMGYLAGGVYHLILFLKRREDKYNLFLGIFSFLFAVYWLTFSMYADTLFASFAGIKKIIEYLSLFWLGPPLLFFLSHFFHNRFSLAGKVATLLIVLLSLPVLFGSYIAIQQALQLWWLVATFFLIYSLGLTISEFRGHKKREAAYLAVGLFVLIIAAIHDIAVSADWIQTPLISKYALIILFISLAFLMLEELILSYKNYELTQSNLEGLITERTRELIEAKKNAEKASLLKSRFLANMSHEMRTPLNAISGYTEYILEHCQTGEEKNILQIVQRAARSLNAQINDILDFSIIESGKIQIVNEPFSLREEILSVIDTLSLSAREKSLKFDFTISEDVPDLLTGDAFRLKQIIMNLLANSIKFTHNGFVHLEIQNSDKQKKTERMKTVFLEFHVIDSGIGIPPEKQQQIFEPFRQADDSITREFGGSGLGLSIVKNLVQLMGGEIGITSPLTNQPANKNISGSDIWFYLPFQIAKIIPKKTKSTAAATKSIDKISKHLTILVAEDNPDNQLLIEMVLTKMGHSVDIAQNGLEAVEKALHKNYDLVLMDIHMPKLNGYEATKRIRKKEKKRVPIFALTADAYQENIEECLRVGMDAHLAKPIQKANLIEALSKI